MTSRLHLMLLCFAGAALAQHDPIAPHPQAPQGQDGNVDLNVYAFYLSGLQARVLLAEAPVRVNRFFSFAPAVAQIGTPSGGSTQIRGSITGSLPVGRFVLEDRNLFLRQFTAGNDDIALYRNRLLLTYPLSIRGTVVRLFVSEEIFYDWRARGFTRYWSSAGGIVDVGQHLRLQAYYTRQHQQGSNVGNIVVFGIALRLPGVTRVMAFQSRSHPAPLVYE
jgi:hypothetical protein